MTHEEAINVIKSYYPPEGSDGRLNQAISLATRALREKADKERRYVVMDRRHDWGSFAVLDTTGEKGHIAYHIATREAAQAIADIYEGVKP